MDNNLNDLKKFIKEKLDILDKSKLKYKDYINSNNIYLDFEKNQFIIKKNEEIIYSKFFSTLGIFDTTSKVWIWSWCMPNLSSDNTKNARRILEYGLMLEPLTNSSMHYYIKSHLVNSRIYFENDILLDIHLGLSIYISKGKFIYYSNKNNIIQYYVVYSD